MSNILKGILNESNPFYGHNDPAREYGADDPPRFNKSRSSYRSQEDDDEYDPYGLIRQEKDFAKGRAMKAAEKAQRDSDHDRLATGTNEGVRDLGYDAQSLIMKLRRDVEEKRLQPTRQAILAAARELAGDMNFAPELLVQQVLGEGVTEGIDDPWGNQGNFAGDKPVNLGNVSMKNIQTGDTVKYLGQPSKVVAMSKDRKHSRITISKGIGEVTQDVLTSDLQQLGRGIEEAKSSLKMGDITDKIKAAVIAATQLKGKVVKTAGGYFKVTTLDDPRPAIIAKPEYYDNLKKYQDQLKVINSAIRDIEMQFESNRREVFNDLDELFPNSPKPLKGGSPASQWLSNALANLRHTYYETNRFKTLINQKKTLEDQLKVLRDTGNRFQEKPIEEMSDNTIQPRMRMNDYYNLADAIQEKLRQAIKFGDKELIQKLNKERDDLDARVKQHGLMPESEQLDELDTKLGLYKIAAGKDATAADKAGDYKRGHKRFKGIMKATEKEFANDARKKKAADERKSAISQGITEFTTAGGPNGPKGPTVGPKGPKGPKDYGQPNSSRYIGKNKFVVGTTLNYVLTATVDKWGLEWDDDDEIWFLDSSESIDIADASEGEIELPDSVTQALTPGNIHDLVSDYLNARNSADLQKVAAYFGHSPDGEMATNEAVSNQANRFNSKQEVINHFVKNGKSAAAGAAAWERGYRGSSNKPIELKKPPQRSYHDDLDDKRYSNTFENLGNQLKSTSFEELVKAKLAIARQIEAEAEAFERDLYKNNTVQKAQQGLRREFEPTPVAQPGEKHSVLKDRLKYLDIAKQKFEEVNRLIKAIRKNYRHYEVANKMDKLDKSLLPYVEVGPKDNYKSLFVKLSKIETELAELYPTAAAAVARKNNQGVTEAHDERDEYDNPRQGRDYGKGNLFVDPGSNEFEKNVPVGVPGGPRGAPKNLKGVSKALPADAFGRTTGKIPRGKPGTVHSKMSNTDEVDEGWSQKYKSSINCSHPKGFSQKAHCAGKKKHNESIDNIMEMTCPDCGMCETHGDNSKDQLDELSCWPGHHRVAGTKAGAPGSCEKNKTNEEGLVEGPALSTSTLTGEIPTLMGIRKKEQRDLIEKYALHNREKDYFELFVELSGKPMPEIYNMNDSHQLAYELYNLGSQIASDWRNISNPTFSRREYLNQIMVDWYNLFKKSIQKYKSMKQGLAEEQLNELDLFAPMTTFIKMTDGSYIQADWRRGQGNPGLEDSASFINFKPVNPNVAKQLGLDSYQRNKSISNYRNGTIAHGGAYQGSGPLATRGYEVVDYNKPETMEELPPEIKPALIKWVQKQNVVEESCPHCNGPMFSEMIMNEKKDACYYKVKSRYKVWPSAYASGALVKCRNKGASNWGNGGKKNESSILEGINRADESLHDWFNKEKWVRMDTKGKIKGPCAREPGEGKPKCLPQSKAHSLGKKGRASAAQRKRREDPNPERSGKAINVDTKKSKG